jgi:hypothetical protein
MNTFNTLLPKLIRDLPDIVSQETIEKLVLSKENSLSFETASECLAELGTSGKDNNSRSQESEKPIDSAKAGDFEAKGEDDLTLNKMKNHYFANVKFKNLVDFAKKDNVFLFNEFSEVDAARNRIGSEIISKYENEFNSFLISLQATEGTDKSTIDDLVQTKLSVDHIN